MTVPHSGRLHACSLHQIRASLFVVAASSLLYRILWIERMTSLFFNFGHPTLVNVINIFSPSLKARTNKLECLYLQDYSGWLTVVAHWQNTCLAIPKSRVESIDTERKNRLLKVCYVPATSATFLAFFSFFLGVAINSTNETNKAGSTGR